MFLSLCGQVLLFSFVFRSKDEARGRGFAQVRLASSATVDVSFWRRVSGERRLRCERDVAFARRCTSVGVLRCSRAPVLLWLLLQR